MKQKIVIRVPMIGEKARSKALKVVVGVSGVESAALTGAKMDQVEVIGENIDAVTLTRTLRKRVACAELVTLGEAKKPEAKKDEIPAPLPLMIGWPAPPYPCFCCEVRDPSCTIL